ncbi:37S ribosomal protein S10, mitochondrial [Aspergillus karnatakaensis]|uniref:mitochondrial 37S ribosomal protein uS10m n=1 Tax=Aspergillus karnatakaensis TaxID=1810916 RepID=UPI003CCE0EC9
MSLLSPHKLVLRATRTFQLAAASRPFSSSTQPSDVEASQPAASGIENTDGTRIQPQPPIDLPVKEWGERLSYINSNARLPRSVQALYLRPLRRKAEYGLPVCDLQLRSYSVRNLEFFADFALRAAYYLSLSVSGPVPLPKHVERWTFPRGNFVHKKSQENFERITLRRLIQIKDGDSQSVQAWLAFLRKHAFYGVGMKANLWEYESIETANNMDQALPDVEKSLEAQFSRFGRREGEISESQATLSEFLGKERLSLKKGPLTDVRRG